MCKKKNRFCRFCKKESCHGMVDLQEKEKLYEGPPLLGFSGGLALNILSTRGSLKKPFTELKKLINCIQDCVKEGNVALIEYFVHRVKGAECFQIQ